MQAFKSKTTLSFVYKFYFFSSQSANELFGLSVGKEIDNLHPQQQALVRLKIQQIFYNLQCPEVYNESEENDPNFQTI